MSAQILTLLSVLFFASGGCHMLTAFDSKHQVMTAINGVLLTGCGILYLIAALRKDAK